MTAREIQRQTKLYTITSYFPSASVLNDSRFFYALNQMKQLLNYPYLLTASKNGGYFSLEELARLKENFFIAWKFNSLVCSNHILA